MKRTLAAYHNILDDRKRSSVLMWASRELKPLLAYVQDRKSTPQQHIASVLNSSKITDLIQQLAEQSGITRAAAAKLFESILNEIAYNKRPFVIRLLAIVLTKICSNIYTGIYVDELGIERLRKTMGTAPVIFLPSHRSYADFILTSYVCFTYNIVIPSTAAGMDFHAMWGMGKMLRDTGAFFMRRAYNGDVFYWDTFKEYFQEILCRGELPITFFLEGTRSRMAKSLPPKFGLLSQVVKAFIGGRIPDALLVPINISYDRVLEENLFAYELLGVPKPKESTSGFLKSLRIIKEHFGNIYVTMGEPISIRAFFADQIDRAQRGFHTPNTELTAHEKQLTLQLGYDVIQRQEQHTVITAFNVIALVLNDDVLSLRTTRVDDLCATYAWVAAFLERLGAVIGAHAPRAALEDALVVHGKLIGVRDNVVSLRDENVDVRTLDANKLRGHALSSRTMRRAVSCITLQLYVNPTLHYTVALSILVTVLKMARPQDQYEVKKYYYALRTCVARDFVAVAQPNDAEFEATLATMQHLNVVRIDNATFKLNECREAELLYNSLQPFLIAYYIVLLILNKVESYVNEKNVLVTAQMFIEQLIEGRSDFVFYYSLTLDTLANCIQMLIGERILVRDKSDSSILLKNDEAKLQSLTALLGECVRVNVEDELPLCISQTVQISAKL